MPGYSGTPLAAKLGIKPGCRVALMNAPRGFEELLDAPEATLTRGYRGKTPCDVILLFCAKTVDLEQGFAKARERLDEAGGLWVAWPKKASGVETDLTEDCVRDYALARGLVDNKVCAIDEVWSGLRLVVRLADRGTRPDGRKGGSHAGEGSVV
jgi:hypothetical protein